MEFLIITGMSGAGKTTALHVLEDVGYYCVDNIPVSLLPTLYELCSKSDDNMMKRTAVVVDVRGTDNFDALYDRLESFKLKHGEISILFIDAKSDCLIARYKETRRRHPLFERIKGGSVAEAVEFEKSVYIPVKNIADFKIDTTHMSNRQLRERVQSIFMEDTSQSLTLTFMSFGFKYGILLEADMLLDVRCLPNPYYIPELKHLTGLDKEVRDFVMDSSDAKEFLKRTTNLLDFLVPLYQKEGKSELIVGVGCTGGKHRSVTLARKLDEHFTEKGYKCIIQHRDVNK